MYNVCRQQGPQPHNLVEMIMCGVTPLVLKPSDCIRPFCLCLIPLYKNQLLWLTMDSIESHRVQSGAAHHRLPCSLQQCDL